MKKSVAIVGAGPAGLITARTLLRTGKFDVTIFEKSSQIGGLWSSEGHIDPRMTTNLCKFTVAFSGLSWDSVAARRDGQPAPLYPKAWQVRSYLEEYKRRYLSDATIHFNASVQHAALKTSNSGSIRKDAWELSVASDDSSCVRHHFDHLVVTTGPFSCPQGLKSDVLSKVREDSRVPIIHSSQYRQLTDLIPDNATTPARRSTLLVVGGSHSGSEAATKLAMGLSTATEPGKKLPYKVVNLTSRRMFAISPLLLTEHNGVQSFEPADFQLYNRSHRPADSPVSFGYSSFDNEKHRGMVGILRQLSGEDAVDGDEANLEKLQLSAVVSDAYSRLVRSGMIQQSQGTLLRLKSTSQDKLTAIFRSPDEIESQIEDIAGIIQGTGFDSAKSMSFLSDEVKDLLEFDAQYAQYPAILATSYMSQNAKVPNLAIVGFASQYWAIMELQARAVAETWTKGHVVPSQEDQENLATFQRQLREQMDAGDLATIHPYPFGDYVGFVEQAARELDLRRVDGKWSATEGPICAARYITQNASEEEQREAVDAIKSLQSIYGNTAAGAPFVAKATFYGLLGGWTTQKDERVGEQDSRPELVFHPRLVEDAEVDYVYVSVIGNTYRTFRYEEGTGDISIWSASEQHLHEAQERIGVLRCGELNAEQRKYTFTFSGPALFVAASTTALPGAEAKYSFHLKATRITHFEVTSGDESITWYPCRII